MILLLFCVYRAPHSLALFFNMYLRLFAILAFWLYSLATQALTSFRWWLMKNDRNLCWYFACLYLHVYALFKLLWLSFAFAVVCRNVIVVRCFFVIVSTLLLNSFPSFIIFRFCSLLRVDLVVAISSIHYILFSNEYSCAPKRDSQSPFFLSFFLFHFGLRLCPFVFHLLCLALFCRG